MWLWPCLHAILQVQGGILNFEVLRPDGTVFSYKTFEREAADAGFHVRTGAECNPGACYNYLGVQVRQEHEQLMPRSCWLLVCLCLCSVCNTISMSCQLVVQQYLVACPQVMVDVLEYRGSAGPTSAAH